MNPKLTDQPAPQAQTKPHQESFVFFKNFGTGREKEFMIENLSILLASGIVMTTALESIKKEVKSKRMRALIQQMQDDIDGGSPLWKALDKTNLFSKHVLALIRVGEESGRLSENLKLILAQQQKDKLLKGRIRSALIYPVILFVMSMIIAVGASWFVLPKLASVFASFNVPLPWTTKLIIGFGQFLQNYGIIAVPLSAAVMIAGVYMLLFHPKTKAFFEEHILLHIPIVKNIIQEIELARAGFIIGNLLGSGIPVVDTLRITSEVTEFSSYRKLMERLRTSIEEGNSFEKSFAAIKNLSLLVPTTTQQLIVSAEQSGTLPDMFYRLGEINTEKSEVTTRDLSSVLEPLLLIIVSLGVFFVTTGIISPIYNLISNVSNISGSQNQTTDTNTAPPIVAPTATSAPIVTEPVLPTTAPTVTPTIQTVTSAPATTSAQSIPAQ